VHKEWPLRQLEAAFPHLDQIKVALLGLTYKPGTDTLRRSSSVELCSNLISRGCVVYCYDPVVKALPASLARAVLSSTLAEAISHADAIIIMTPWAEITQADWTELLQGVKDGTVIIDVNHALCLPQSSSRKVRYLALGTP